MIILSRKKRECWRKLVDKMSDLEKKVMSAKKADQMRQMRERRKHEKENKVKTSAYKTNSALGKAATKLRKSLPNDPYKAKVLMNREINIINSSVNLSRDVDILPEKVPRGISMTIKDTVANYYLRP